MQIKKRVVYIRSQIVTLKVLKKKGKKKKFLTMEFFKIKKLRSIKRKNKNKLKKEKKKKRKRERERDIESNKKEKRELQ